MHEFMRKFAHEFVDEFFANFVHEFKYEIRTNSHEFANSYEFFCTKNWLCYEWSALWEFEVRSTGVIQLLIELNFLSDFAKEETGNFQTVLSIKNCYTKLTGMKNYDPPLSDS